MNHDGRLETGEFVLVQGATICYDPKAENLEARNDFLWWHCS